LPPRRGIADFLSGISIFALKTSTIDVCFILDHLLQGESETKFMITLPAETERLVRLMAAHRGKTPEDVLKEAVETQARLVGISMSEALRIKDRIDMDRVREIIDRVASKPLLDPRSPNEILDEAWGDLR
jgi:antitoxin VapB